MSRGPEAAALRGGRHRAARPEGVGPALARALVATLLPGVVLGVGVWYYFTAVNSGQAIDLATSPRALLWLVAGIGVVWLAWVSAIWRTYTRRRPPNLAAGARLLGTICVFLLIGAVTAPMAVGARYAVVQRDLIRNVFTDEESATTPDVTAGNPWGRRKRVNVLLLGGDGSVHRPGVRTDSVILASIDTRTGATVLFSLPRNLQRVPFKEGSELDELYPDGFTDGVQDNAEFFLNAVYRNVPAVHPGVLGRTDNEGADAVKLAVSGALGIRVDYYVLVNLAGFEQLVDAIGGITVNINKPVPIGGNTDAGIAPDDYLQPGPDQRLDGFEALWFTRGRYGSTDYERMQRQRCAIDAITAEARPGKLLFRYTRLAKASKEIVRTDIPRKLLSDFVDLALKVKKRPIKSVGFERSATFFPDDPDYDFVHAAVDAALNPVRRPTGNTTPNADKDPSKASDTKQDCAYRPEE